jgi:DNA-binding transcriptional MocR family regulator
MAARYAARRTALVRALRDEGVEIACGERGEGLHLWLPVPHEAAVAQFMAARSWAVQAGAPLRLQAGPAIRVSIGTVGPRDMARLARDLAAALRHTARAVF